MRYELYRFSYGTNEWFFTSGIRAISFNGKSYLPVHGLSRDDIEDSGIDKADFDITFPQIKLLNKESVDLSELFISRILVDTVSVDIIEIDGNESLVLFKGRVIQPSFDEDQKTMTLTVSSGETYQNRNILTRKFQRSCPNKIYDRFCGVDFERWSSKVKVIAINGLDITVAYNDDISIKEFTNENSDHVKETTTFKTTFVAGIVSKNKTVRIEITDHITGVVSVTTNSSNEFTREDSNPYSRGLIVKDGVEVYVVNSDGMTLGLYRKMPNLKVNDIVYIAMGCDQSFASCKTFKNNLRYMGFPFMPNSNPVNDQIIK